MKNASWAVLFLCLISLLAAPATAFANGPKVSAAAGSPDEHVPSALIEKAALYYGQEQWPGCRLIAITPYYALDGTVNAYAAQFAKEGCSLRSESEIAEAVTIGEEELKNFRENRALKLETSKSVGAREDANSESDIADAKGGSMEGSHGYSAPVEMYLPPGAARVPETGREGVPGCDEKAFNDEEEYRELTNASVLADEIGTVIIAARRDLYPPLERFDGAAPHVKFSSKAKGLAGVPDPREDAIARAYYLGPMAVFLEIRGGAIKGGSPETLLVDPMSDRVFDATGRKFSAGEGRLAPARHGKCSIRPERFWDSMEKEGKPPAAGMRNDYWKELADVPYYHQDDYAPKTCAPTASAQALGYWDGHGYGNLVDRGGCYTGSHEELVYNLMRAEGYTPDTGADLSDVAPGIEAVCNSSSYGNNLSFYAALDSGVSWQDDIMAEIDAGCPFVYNNGYMDMYPYWSHCTTGTGYVDFWHILYVHYNYPPDTPYQLFWDNIPPNNEVMIRIHPGATATFDCIWSEDFEDASMSPWEVFYTSGSYPASWSNKTYRSHNTTTDPTPPGGANSWSGYCVGSDIDPPGPYPDDANCWMVYGPFSTMGRSAGEVDAYIWRDFGDSNDHVSLLASIDGSTFHGTAYFDDDLSWQRKVLDLSNVYGIGNVMNRPQVWVAVTFVSDSSGTSEGAYVDDITIKISGGPPPTPTPGPSGIPHYIAAVDVAGGGTGLAVLTKDDLNKDVNLYYYNKPVQGDWVYWNCFARNPSPFARDLWQIPNGNDAVGMTSVDITGDGQGEVATLVSQNAGDLNIYFWNSLQTGDWRYWDCYARNPSPLACDLWQIPMGNDAVGMTSVDITGDGKDELALLVSQNAGDLNIYFWNAPVPGDWRYWDCYARNPSPLARDFWQIPMGNDAVGMASVDITGDGKDELALLVSQNEGDLNIYFWNAPVPGDWRYWDCYSRNPSPRARDLWQIPTGNDAVGMTSVDITGDGEDELALLVSQNAGDLNVYFWNSPVSGDWRYWDSYARNPSPRARDLWCIPSLR